MDSEQKVKYFKELSYVINEHMQPCELIEKFKLFSQI